jgi:hypothetical protein
MQDAVLVAKAIGLAVQVRLERLHQILRVVGVDAAQPVVEAGISSASERPRSIFQRDDT